jgi:NAD(P)-dependent dehydrogenase (short-subunit alcohol dehydrogenase family)
MGDLDGKRAVVTGAGSGIGAELVTQLVDRGASVLAVDINEVGLASVADRTGCLTRIVDVTSEADNAAMAGAADREFGGLDLAFLNAGVLGRPYQEQSEPLTDVAGLAGRYRQVVAVNVDGVIWGTLAVADVMGDGGAIVATASVAGLIPWAPDPLYTVTKHGVVGWVRSIAPALSQQRISIDAICPGGVATPLVGRVAEVAEANPSILSPAQVAEAIIDTALEDDTGRAVSVVGGRDPVRMEHTFAPVAGFASRSGQN